MQTLVAIKDGKVKTTVGNWDKPDRAHLQAGEQAQIVAEHGAGTTFEVVTDPDQAAVEARNLIPDWDWNAGKGTGTEPAATKAEREALEAAIADEAAAKTDAALMVDNLKAIADGTFVGTTETAQRVIARAVLFLVLKGTRVDAADLKPEAIEP